MTAVRTPPWLALAAFVAVGPAHAQPAPPAAETAAPSAAEPLAGASGGVKLKLAPVLVTGSVAYDFRGTRGSDHGSTSSHLVTTNLNARTYIWQPWFATLSGNLALTASTFRADPGNADFSAGRESTRTTGEFMTGKARLDVFPQSRFPFEAHAERSDSRIDSGLASPISFRSQNFGLSQRYRPESGAYELRGAFDRREQLALGSRSVQDALSGDLSTHWKSNSLSVGLAYSQAHSRPTDERSEFRSLVVRHRYAPASELSIDTTANWSRAQDDLVNAHSDLSILQWSSVGLWHRNGSRLTLTGAARGLAMTDASGNQFDTLGGTVGANYQLDRHFFVAASLGASTSSSAASHSTGLSGSATAGWQADPIQLFGAQYERFASIGLSASRTDASVVADLNQSVDRKMLQTNVNGQVGHSLSRTWRLGTMSSFVVNAAETFAASQTHAPQDEGLASNSGTRMMLHTLAGTWNVNGESRSAFARITASDSSELSGTQARFQLLNGQLSGNWQIDRNRSLTGDLTIQRSHHQGGQLRGPGSLPFTGSSASSTSAGGELNYRQQRVFGVPGLRFTSRLRLARDVLREAGTLASIPDRETRLWENRLDWSIGRLDTQVLLRLSEIDGRREDLLMFRVQRNFGD